MPTGFPTASAATSVTSLADLYEKSNTDVKTAIKVIQEEAKWFRSYPRENIVVSGNENRVPLILTQPNAPSWIPDGGKERIMSTPAPTHGTFLPTQANVRHGYTGLAMALTNRARAGMIEDQTTYQSQMSGYSIARYAIGLSTYGTSVGTQAVVKTTGSSAAAQSIPLKNAYGSSTWVAGGDGGVQDAYLSAIFRVNDRIALIRAGALVEFATVTASPGASGVGYIDATFTSSITPTVGDLVVFAMADGDVTITGTDYNNAPSGFTDFALASSAMGVTTASYPAWAAGSTQTTAQRLSFQVKERMINECWNAAGVKLDRFIVAQGVRRDAIAGELGGRRYDSSETDLEGDLNAGAGQQYFTSGLALPNTFLGWYSKAISKIELSDAPDENGASKSIFKLDKVQGASQVAAGYDYFMQRICSSRAAIGYATNLSSA